MKIGLEPIMMDYDSTVLPLNYSTFVRGQSGIEPTFLILKTKVLPLNYVPNNDPYTIFM